MTSYLSILSNYPVKDSYFKWEILRDDLRMKSWKDLSMYYAPFDHIQKEAKVVLIGITPGWTQTEIAYRTYVRSIAKGETPQRALLRVKSEASFGGRMRKNLITMLDAIGLNTKLRISTCNDLFENYGLLHSTSLLRYPVFKSEDNYSGYSPPLTNPVICRWVREFGIKELNLFRNALLIPLGKMVDITIKREINNLSQNKILTGFPHPSPGNGHRLKIFKKEFTSLCSAIKNWNP